MKGNNDINHFNFYCESSNEKIYFANNSIDFPLETTRHFNSFILWISLIFEQLKKYFFFT